MYASIFVAAKRTGFRFELIVHKTPALHSDSVQQSLYFDSKVDAKREAKKMNLTPWNY